MSNLRSNMMSIGDRTYTVNQKIVDGEVEDETIETNMDENDVAVFKKDWEESSFPRIHALEELPGVFDLILIFNLAFLVAGIIFVGVKAAFPEVDLQMIGGMSMIGYFVTSRLFMMGAYENLLQETRRFPLLMLTIEYIDYMTII